MTASGGWRTPREFENFVLDKRQIAPALLALLQAEAGNKLTDLGDRIVISHLYIERRMVPLNLCWSRLTARHCVMR
ncbi:isocitrate dehydrogenase phosphatase [Klebsiella pneumoniae]|uniref:Isocitrate dehydrogenase phosphatase n=1 Tax=Klebsiella pneumoniae TaxID=573 RepID=A0A447RWQ8_KLEPN|nr:isocitrate dehydrogenase phosphatase [Klebsiella pneumoniae]